jgi:hypothetical protein
MPSVLPQHKSEDTKTAREAGVSERTKMIIVAILAWLADAVGLKGSRNWLLVWIGCKAVRELKENDTIATLERLARLRDSGVLSEAEFRTMKAQVLSKP